MSSNINKMYLFKFLTGMHFFAGVLIPFFTQWGGITFLQVMLLQSWFVVWISILEIPTGAVADTLGRKASLILGAAFQIAAVVVYQWRPDFKVFLLGEFLWAFAFAFISGADQALIYDSLKQTGNEKTSKSVLARFSSLELGAIMLSAPIGSLIAERWGLQATVLCMAAPFSLAFLVALALDEPAPKPGPRKPYFQMLFDGLRYFLGHPTLRCLAFDSISISILSFMCIWLFQPALTNLGVPLGVFGFVTAGITGAQILIMNQFDRLERWLGGRKRYLLFSALIPGMAYILLGTSLQPGLAIAAIVALTGFGLSRSVLLANYMNKHIESHHRATVLSSVGMARQLSVAVLYPLVGLLAQWSLRGTFIVLGAAAVICACVSWVEESHLID